MRSHPMKASSCAKFLALGIAGATACSQGLTDSASRHSRVVLDVRSIVGGDFLTVVDTAHLTIFSGGDEVTLTQLLGPGDDETTFDVTVNAGTVRFSVDIISNNGTPVYRGETSATIDADGFAVSIIPQPINPVMMVLPRRPTFDTTTVQFGNSLLRQYTATLRVRNPGLATLTWRVDSLVALPQGASISCSAPSEDASCLESLPWAAAKDETIFVTFSLPFTPGTPPPQLPTQGIRFVSNVGSFTIPTVP